MFSKINFAPISVIIPCFNCHDTIDMAINSVLKQTLKPYQIIMINDGSSDTYKTKNKLMFLKSKINSIYKQINVEIIELKMNKGPSFVRNLGWEKASEEFIAFLDADDFWHPEKIKLQFKWMNKNTEFKITGHQTSSKKLNFYNKKKLNLTGKKVTIKQLIFFNYFQTSSVMIKKDVYPRFNKNIRFGEDYNLWLRLSNKINMYFFYNVLSFSQRKPFSKGGLSGNLLDMEKSELISVVEQYRYKNINFFYLTFAITFSLIKFCRRILIRKLS